MKLAVTTPQGSGEFRMDVQKNARLTLHCRALLVDRVMKGLTQAQVAHELGVSIKTRPARGAPVSG